MVRTLEWDCQQSGCFVDKRLLKLDLFADCLPEDMAFGDLDGYAEIGGRLCILEWKDTAPEKEIPKAQDLAFRKLTKDTGNVVFVIFGVAETMAVTAYYFYKAGTKSETVEVDLTDVKAHIKKWADWANDNKRVGYIKID